MDGLTEGRIVHYVLNEGSVGDHRPAMVVRVWRANGTPQENGICQLQVFLDGSNDQPGPYDPSAPATVWKTSVVNDEAGKAPGTGSSGRKPRPGVGS